MKFTKTKLNGVFIIEPNVLEDQRGQFIKVFNKESFAMEKLSFNLEESYFSLSKKNVIRGMHFQTPPRDHTKLVYATHGAIIDVVLDIRVGSPTYGKYIKIELSEQNHTVIYIPSGFAHGFLSLKNNSLVVYLQTSGYSPANDGGIRADSFKMRWNVARPIVSNRDKSFPPLGKFKSPFKYKAVRK